SLSMPDTQIYTTLKQYKGPSANVAARQRLRLAGLIGLFLDRHARCLSPDEWTAVAVVPSKSGRIGQHPLETTLRMIRSVRTEVADVLHIGPGGVGRNTAAIDAYQVGGTVKAQRVLLVDDTYTTGAHLHAAVAALEIAGATEVVPLVVGRHLRRDWLPSAPLIEWTMDAKNRWSPDLCIHCRL